MRPPPARMPWSPCARRFARPSPAPTSGDEASGKRLPASGPTMSSGSALAGTVALVTGVGRAGQAGETVAQAFADAGAVVCIVSRNAQQVAERAAVLADRGATVHGFGCDLTDPGAVADLAAR